MSKRKSTQVVRVKRRVLWKKQSRCCFWCAGPIEAPDDGSLDHLIPERLGGPLGYWNLVLACKTCNVSRGALSLGVRRSSRDGWVVWSPTEGNVVIYSRGDERLARIRAELIGSERSRFQMLGGCV